MNKFSLFTLVTLMIAGVLSCKKDREEPEPKKYYYSYFPLQEGLYRVYEVDSAVYRGINPPGHNTTPPDVTRYEIREEIAAAITDNTGEQAYKIERYRRNSPSDNWTLERVYTAKRTEREAQRVEENTRYLKMVFPVEPERQWDANKYNNEDSAGFKVSTYKEAHQPWANSFVSFDSTVLVELDNYEDLINRFYNVERYAAGAGLVYSKNDSLNTQTKGTSEYINGYSVEMRLKESGGK